MKRSQSSTSTSVTKPQDKHHLWAEVLNAITHGIAAIMSIIGTVFLIKKGLNAESKISIIAYMIYGLSLITLFSNSTLYHSLTFTKFKKIFQKLDHSSIYLLIAGTYTPYLMVSIGGKMGYLFLTLIWALAFIGITFEMITINRFPRLSTFMYLGLGWLGLLIFYPLFKSIEINGVVLLAVGGLFYSLGTIFYSMKHNRWMHVVWHLFVLAGALFMFISIYQYV
ncbi:hemolysin III family protein [Facklamia sp. DSM 111018]|uniref:Hemolysin III family protein n=1 Tax=Facklamia lactis TaxID=2749967 RepID=A0ABS0LME4_9LACT|nr:hemolysin III family protein [Facklamia lactis]MBG9979990.1 hemolysin III family protein [Facklamia lactis]MBG9985330.1 hemolysin III family protein [Facklamia lactis]